MNLLRLILFTTISLCGVASAGAESEIVERGGYGNGDREILDVQTEAELRSILREVGQKLIPSKCSDWNEDEPRVAAVMNLGGFKELWIGSEYSDSEGLGIEGFQKRYEIRDLSMGGLPLRGSIDIRLSSGEMNVERACFNKMKDVQVRGSNDDGGMYKGNLWKMTIIESKFGVLVESQGISGERIATGETQVTLTMSEGLLAMALRKSAEHLWALPGSLGLLILWAFGGQILRRMQAKWRSQSKSDPRG